MDRLTISSFISAMRGMDRHSGRPLRRQPLGRHSPFLDRVSRTRFSCPGRRRDPRDLWLDRLDPGGCGPVRGGRLHRRRSGPAVGAWPRWRGHSGRPASSRRAGALSPGRGHHTAALGRGQACAVASGFQRQVRLGGFLLGRLDELPVCS